MSLDSPLISVITATYNRSNVLFYSISSVVRSTFSDWELFVGGDACTDNTEEVMDSFRDPRIRFFNLENNFGDQGGPNNEGFRLSRGRYISYLSHDDMWMPYHLDTVIKGFEESDADMVITAGLRIRPNAQNKLMGIMPGDRFVPYSVIPASLWTLKRELLEEFGPWLHPKQCFLPPSQDLLLKIWASGRKIAVIPRVTVVIIPAGIREGIYSSRQEEENKVYFERLKTESDFLEKELFAVIRSLTFESGKPAVLANFRISFINLLKSSAFKLGIPPMKVAYIRDYHKKGTSINRWRKKCGLTKLK